MDEEKKIEQFKPSTMLYVLLFVYYSIWIIQGCGAVSHYWSFGFGEFEKYGLTGWLIFGLFLVAACYSLYAVIKTLRGDKDCITVLKWSLIIVFLYTLFDKNRTQIATCNPWILWGFFLLRPGFYLLFYLYLCFSKSIKARYPKLERRFSPSGWVWSILLTALLAIGGYKAYEEHRINQYCKAYNIDVPDGHYTDGMIIFQSKNNWQKWENPPDTIWIDDVIEAFPTLLYKDSVNRAYLYTGRCYAPTARTFNQVLVPIVCSLSNSLEIPLEDIKEGEYIDTIIGNNRILSTGFEAMVDSLFIPIQVDMIYENNGPKCAMVVAISKQEYTRVAEDIARSIQFDLQSLAKSKDNKQGNDAKHQKSDRVSQCNDKTDPNVLASFLHGVAPRFSVGVMLLQHCEREVAQRKHDNIFYNIQIGHN